MGKNKMTKKADKKVDIGGYGILYY